MSPSFVRSSSVPSSHHDTPDRELLAVLTWINRHQLASRFPAWRSVARLDAAAGAETSPSAPRRAASS